METTLREIVLAIPALSKLAAAPLRLRSAYRLQKLTSALQKEADFSPSSGRRFYPHTAKRTAAESIIFGRAGAGSCLQAGRTAGYGSLPGV